MKVGTKVSLSSYKKKIDSLLYQPSLYWASQKNFRLELESAVPCIQEVSTLYSLGSGKRAGSTDLVIWPWHYQILVKNFDQYLKSTMFYLHENLSPVSKHIWICPKLFKYRVCVTLAFFYFFTSSKIYGIWFIKEDYSIYFFLRLSHCRILKKRNLLSTGPTIFWSIKKNLSELSMRTWTLRLVLFSCPISNGVVNK